MAIEIALMSHPKYQLAVDNRHQLTVASSPWQSQPMVAKEINRKEFSNRLNAACDRAGIRLHGRAVDIRQDLKPLGVTVTTTAVGKWLNGDAIPGIEKLRVLAEWLNVRVEWLHYGLGDMERTYKDAGATKSFAVREKAPPSWPSLMHESEVINTRFKKILAAFNTAEIEQWLQFGENLLMSRPPGLRKTMEGGGMQKKAKKL